MNRKKKLEEEREKLISDLNSSLAEIKTLKGIIPICMHCKKIRDVIEEVGINSNNILQNTQKPNLATVSAKNVWQNIIQNSH